MLFSVMTRISVGVVHVLKLFIKNFVDYIHYNIDFITLRFCVYGLYFEYLI